MVLLEKAYNYLLVYQDRRIIGSVTLYDLPEYSANHYLKLDLDTLDRDSGPELLHRVRMIAHKPMLVKVSSDDLSMVRFLTASGFSCKRRRYRVKAGMDDYIANTGSVVLHEASRGQRDYARCCRKLYEHHLACYGSVEPWTAGFDAFSRMLPEKVVYSVNRGDIGSAAFVDRSEVVGICGLNKRSLRNFAQCLAISLLLRYETVCFEYDSCDWASMVLQSLFRNLGTTSMDTYVYDDRGSLQLDFSAAPEQGIAREIVGTDKD